MYLNSELEVEAVASEALADLNMILSRDIVAALELGIEQASPVGSNSKVDELDAFSAQNTCLVSTAMSTQ